MKLTLGQAAKHCGFSKPTLSRAIKSGRLSATRLDDGSYAVDPAELQRWVENNAHANSHVKRVETPPETPETPISDNALQAEVQKLRELLDAMGTERDRERAQASDQIADLRRRLDRAEDRADKEAEVSRRLMLSHETARSEPAAVAERPKGIFGWLGRRSA